MTVEISTDVHRGDTKFDWPDNKTPTAVARPSKAGTKMRPNDLSDATAIYTVGSYLAAQLSQIGLKRNCSVAGNKRRRHENNKEKLKK